jgi:hemerythrin-like metal-binding protein
MTFAEWDQDRYGVGVERIDDQHRELFGILNELHNAMKEGKGRDAVEDSLAELEEYTRYHFGDEEEFMVDCGYEAACSECFARHTDAHRAFESRVAEIRQKHEAGETLASIETLRLLRDWLADHIDGAEMDQDYAAFVE